ncbi:hypothetical protein J7E62_09290 [Variovorax paradoxus]|nr:hypothetical protein [Variovorax paradoxus]
MTNATTKSLVEMWAAIATAEAVRSAEPPPPPKPAAPNPVPRRAKGTPTIDFHAVAWDHNDIDGRLRNWGAWCKGTPANSSSPMFRLAAPPPRVRSDRNASTSTIDRADAIRIAQGVTALPEKHAAALNWCYVRPVNPRRACMSIGTTMEGLADLLYEGRQMLINRKV